MLHVRLDCCESRNDPGIHTRKRINRINLSASDKQKNFRPSMDGNNRVGSISVVFRVSCNSYCISDDKTAACLVLFFRG